jgi:preprotein translocase subunit SecB
MRRLFFVKTPMMLASMPFWRRVVSTTVFASGFNAAKIVPV